MSELADLIDTILREWEDRGIFTDQHVAGRVGLAKEISDLLPAHEAEIRAEAEREQYERDCRANCHECDVHETAVPSVGGMWVHQHTGYDSECHSFRIHSAWAKAHPEESGPDDVVARSLRSRLHANETMFDDKGRVKRCFICGGDGTHEQKEAQGE